MEFIMRTINTCLLSLFIALFALPAFADDALIAELIRLDEARRAETQTLHIEYDVVRTYGKFSKLPAFFPKLVAKVYTNIIFMI